MEKDREVRTVVLAEVALAQACGGQLENPARNLHTRRRTARCRAGKRRLPLEERACCSCTACEVGYKEEGKGDAYKAEHWL